MASDPTWAPTPGDVENVIARLAVDETGATGTFTDTSTPTTAQVSELVSARVERLVGRFGDIPDGLTGLAKAAAAIGAAASIARSFYPEGEQLARDLDAEYASVVKDLVAGFERLVPGTIPGDGTTGGGVATPATAVGQYPDPGPAYVW